MTLIYGLGIILIILAVLMLVGLIHIATAGASTLLVVGIICVVAAYLFGRRGNL